MNITKIYSIDNFLKVIKSEPDKWKNYCEIIIFPTGRITQATPSHTEKLIEIYCEKEAISRKQFQKQIPVYLAIIDFICEKYGLICVWYNYIIRPNKITRFQENTIKILKANGLINIETEKIATEYTWYLEDLKRKEELSENKKVLD